LLRKCSAEYRRALEECRRKLVEKAIQVSMGTEEDEEEDEEENIGGKDFLIGEQVGRLHSSRKKFEYTKKEGHEYRQQWCPASGDARGCARAASSSYQPRPKCPQFRVKRSFKIC